MHLQQKKSTTLLPDTGERMIPPSDDEVSFVFSRHRFAYQFAVQYVRDCAVVDVGCGTGYGCKILAETARWVCGVDHDLSALQYCQREFGAGNISHALMNAGELGLLPGFDLAVSFQVIEHVADVHNFVEQLRSVVRREGRIIISTPNVPVDRQSADGNPFHQSEMNDGQFSALMHKHFKRCEILGVTYASQSFARSVIQKLPCYRCGVLLKRKSIVKKLANQALDLTKFRVTATDRRNAMDLIAVCENR